MSRSRLTDMPVVWRLGDGARPRGPHVAVVSGAAAPLLALDLPDGLRGMARERVAQRQVSEAMALPPDQVELHPFAPEPRISFRKMLVAEASAAAQWRADLRPGCLALLPDYLALPCIADVWTVQVGTAGEVAVRLGVADGFGAEANLAIRLLAQAERPRVVLRLGPPDAALDAFLQSLDVPVHADLDAAALGRPLRWALAAGGIDLRTAPSALYERIGATLAQWRWPVMVAGLALAAYLANLTLETRKLEDAAVRDLDLTREIVRQHFVPEGPILNVRAQVQTAVAAAAVPQAVIQDVPPLIQFQRAAPLLSRDAVSLQLAEYRADTGLVTSVEAVDFAGLDALVADLRAGGFLVEVLDSRSQPSGGIAARLRLQPEVSR